jgi:tRNA(Ile)-lysidine synthase
MVASVKQVLEPPLPDRVLKFIKEHRLISGRGKLVVAVSGGPDSVCLLHILLDLRDRLGITLHVAHLNHGLRGAESDADASYVTKLAQKLNLPATIERRDVPAYQKSKRLSLEEAAREVRYGFLAEVVKAIGADSVAVGHTLDDHIETILMHLIRGSGTRGLRGLQPSSQLQLGETSLTIIRPLLEVSREETAAYCRRYRLKPRLDTSNLSLSPLRNRIRQQLIPLLESYNPQVTDALLRTARIAADDLAALEEVALEPERNAVKEQGNTVILEKESFLKLPVALQRYLLRSAIEKRLGNLMDIESRHIEEIMAARHRPAGKIITLPDGLVFVVEYDRYLLGSDPATLSRFPRIENEYKLRIPGTTELPGWRVKASVVRQNQVLAEQNNYAAYFDLDCTGDKLTVRPRRPGDRFQPLGMDRPKKLNEFMIDSKIPRPWRRRVPLVCSPERVIWVVGWRIDERARVTGDTRNVLRLEATRPAE